MGVSDHSPVLVLASEDCRVVRRFSFLNSCINHPDYQSTITNAWCTSKAGSPSFCFFQKLKNVKHALTGLLRSNPFSTDLIQEERVRLVEFSRLKTAELAMLSQRAKLMHIQQGDSCSKYFFTKINKRKHQEIIGAIQDQHGVLQLELDNISSAFQDYYPDLLVMDYRPISCCTIFYKTISKILTNRLQHVLPTIIDEEQAAFIKGRNIFENIILSQLLVKGYSRKNISPRCLIKLDIRKAFDTLQWKFIANMLQINGGISGFFPGKSGITQGDPLSPYLFVLSMEVVSRYLRILSQKEYISFHPKCSKVNLTHLVFADDLMIFIRGDVPSVLAVKNDLSDFAALSRLAAKIILTSILVVFLLLILASTGLLSWKHICSPWENGGFNIKDAAIWKILLLLKGVWKLSSPPEGFGLGGMPIIFSQNIWTITSKEWFSTSFKDILKARDRLIALTGNMQSFKDLLCSWAKEVVLSPGIVYKFLRASLSAGLWTKGLACSSIIPSTRVICSLVAQHQLATVDNIKRRGFEFINRCVLCEQQEETHDHRFFQCSYSNVVWSDILKYMGISHAGQVLSQELAITITCATSDRWKNAWFHISLAAVIYQLWRERNARIFQQLLTSAVDLVRRIKYIVVVPMLMNASSLTHDSMLNCLNS
ncbi:uncharacterized protein LOC141617794 [Silene latifolia]|uniref:uncharacterized protein LOC141617794 n=1 Tax=Silene latifolia TaxID=37657 RepID=UPI003D789D81